MVGILLGILAMALGLAGFTGEGLHWIRQKKINETLARAIGSVCILLGIAAVGREVWLIWPTTPKFQNYQPPLEPPPPPPLAYADPAQPSRYFTDNRKCSAEFPEPAYQTKLTLSPRVHDIAMIRQNRSELFSLSRADFSDLEPENRPSLETFVERFRQDVLNSRMIDDRKYDELENVELECDGVPGRRLVYQVGTKSVSYYFIFLFEGDGYTASVATGIERRGDPEVERFLSSIQFEQQ